MTDLSTKRFGPTNIKVMTGIIDANSMAKAIGVSPGVKGGIRLTAKKNAKHSQQPASYCNIINWGANKTNRKLVQSSNKAYSY